MRNRPSTHLFLLLLLFGLNAIAYLAIYRAGVTRGFSPSLLLAARDLALLLPIMFVLLWLTRRHKFRGNLVLFTLGILLFSVGLVAQYRLFTDPEYSARSKSTARMEKTQTLRQRYVNEHYDAEKKKALFGSENFQIPIQAGTEQEERYWTVGRILTATSSYIPVLALIGFALAFSFLKRDDVLLWLQKHSFLIGIVTTIPFLLIAVIGSSAGKFLGNTTPWEPVKITFLISYAGILADHYRNLSRTYWGVPSLRFLLPFLAVAAMPIIPFFALSDFGQMMVFFGAYVTLYVVAVRRLPQVTVAILMIVSLLVVSIFAAGIYNTVVDIFTDQAQVGAVERVKNVVSRGVPRRIHQRFHLWLHAETPPDPENDWWWEKESDRLEARGLTNEQAWYDSYAFQPTQALFGVSDGRVLGAGLGRGYPEIVPIADSDFIYAALAEETGLIGGAVIILGLIILMLAGMKTAIDARDMFTKLLATGITAFLCFQAIVNIGGVIRMLPMTGITLPFVSHGGWSLITSFVMLGMLMAISHRNASSSESPQ
ncbi:MAG TPA: FtsW/RodA/SpoVE family cell cycle protein [Blastocatellia bacterium]|nr:FtsW/RodA/SpoVE family cell cycle protein [Blastocatellia bacterium]